MNNFKKLALIAAISGTVALTGCGGGGSGGSSGGSGGDSGETISGTATAPGGVIALYESQSLLQIAANFVIPPAAAADLGLDPVKGAEVQLIRVDDNGAMIGDVLATTKTSITGDYTLTLPAGVNLAGNLVVRIIGQNNNELRAQVVDRSVDINPVSEFVLRKFIETGADLDQLVVNDVVKLKGKVAEFDLSKAAGANLEQVFANLAREVGAFMETATAAISAPKGNAASVAGNYFNAALGLEFHDSDNDSWGSFANDIWLGNFIFADGGNGVVNLTMQSEEGGYGRLSGASVNDYNSIYYDIYKEDGEPETFPGVLNARGILSVEGEFEEELDTEYGLGWRSPAYTYVFQQVADLGLFFGLPHEAAVRYNLTLEGALNPNAKSGDEVFRSLEVFSRQPANLTAADMAGTYGRVYLGTVLASDFLELTTEVTPVTFDSQFNATLGSGTANIVSISGADEQAIGFDEPTEAEGPIPMNIQANGAILGDGDGIIGFVNKEAGYLDFSEHASATNEGAEFHKTMMVKLPASKPSIANKKYRLMMLSTEISGSGQNPLAMYASQFNTTMTMTSETTGTVSGTISEIRMPSGLGSNIEAESETLENGDFNVVIGNNGAATLTFADEEGSTVFNGFFGEGAKLGVFTVGSKDGTEHFTELGLAVLIDVTGR